MLFLSKTRFWLSFLVCSQEKWCVRRLFKEISLSPSSYSEDSLLLTPSYFKKTWRGIDFSRLSLFLPPSFPLPSSRRVDGGKRSELYKFIWFLSLVMQEITRSVHHENEEELWCRKFSSHLTIEKFTRHDDALSAPCALKKRIKFCNKKKTSLDHPESPVWTSGDRKSLVDVVCVMFCDEKRGQKRRRSKETVMIRKGMEAQSPFVSHATTPNFIIIPRRYTLESSSSSCSLF